MTALEVRPLHPAERGAAAELLRRRYGAPVFLVPGADGTPSHPVDLRPDRAAAGVDDPLAAVASAPTNDLHVSAVPGPMGPRAVAVVRRFAADEAAAGGRPLHRVVVLAADPAAGGVGPLLVADVVARALVADVVARALADDGAELRWSVSNDDLVLQRLLARAGFAIAAVRLGAVDAARDRWPGLADHGVTGRPRRDEVEYVHDPAGPGLEMPSASGGTRWIRAAFAEDAARFREIVVAELARLGLPPAPHDTDRDLEDPFGFFVESGGAFDAVVEGLGERLVGGVGLRPLPGTEGTVELRKMYLDPAVRGEGIGRRLLAHALHRARGLGARRVVLQTHGAMTVAHRLYEEAGFRPDPAARLETDCERAYALDLDA